MKSQLAGVFGLFILLLWFLAKLAAGVYFLGFAFLLGLMIILILR